MQTGFWNERWQRNEIAFHQEHFNPSLLQFWPLLGLAPGTKVFVPLCGKSRDMCWLRDQGHAVLGIEIVEVAVRDFFAESGLTPEVSDERPFRHYHSEGTTVLCGDFFSLMPVDLEDVAAVYDRASLIAFAPSQRGSYAAKLAEVLPAQVEMLLISITYPQEQMPGPPFSVPEGEVRELFEEHFTVERLAQHDVLAESPRFRERGLTSLSTEVYRVRR